MAWALRSSVEWPVSTVMGEERARLFASRVVGAMFDTAEASPSPAGLFLRPPPADGG
jgi:hypothetical protein